MSIINLQPLIENLHYILVGFGFVLWALAQLVSARAKTDPAKDSWDQWSEKITWASGLYSQALDWLSATGNLNLGVDQTKLGELNKLVKGFKERVSKGEYLEAINDVIGFWTSAKSKLPSALADVKIPPASIPPVGGQTEAGLQTR